VNAISGDSASDIWVVGETATRGYTGGPRTSVLLHYNGAAWSQVAVPDSSGLLDVDAISPTDVYVVQLGGLWHYNGTAWTTTSIPSGVNVLTAPRCCFSRPRLVRWLLLPVERGYRADGAEQNVRLTAASDVARRGAAPGSPHPGRRRP
jgi:hypothetical protein